MRSGCCLFLPSISDYSLTLPNLYFPPFYSICPSAFPGLSKLHKSPPFTSLPPLLSLKCSPSLPSLRVPPSNYYDTILCHHSTRQLLSSLMMISMWLNSVDGFHLTSFLSITWQDYPQPPDETSCSFSLATDSFAASSSGAGWLYFSLCHSSSQPLFSSHPVATFTQQSLLRLLCSHYADPGIPQVGDSTWSFCSPTACSVPCFHFDVLVWARLDRQSLSCVRLFCGPMDCNLPGFSVHGISHARILGVGSHFLLQGIFLTQGSNHVSCIGRWILYHWATWEKPLLT